MHEAVVGFTEEEKRLRVRMAEKGLRVKDIAAHCGIRSQDVTAVIRGKSRSPRYVAKVYAHLGLEIPATES